MYRVAFVLSVAVIALSAGFASAQSPAVGQLPPVGDLYGYSPLVPTIDPFPTRTSGYAYSMFLPKIGGKRINPPPGVHYPPVITVIHEPAAVVPQDQPAVLAGPVVLPAPPRGLHRFIHRSASAIP